MIVIGYLYNQNGMASWCWEAVNALAEAGLDTCLVCKKGVKIPGGNNIKVVFIEELEDGGNKNIFKRIKIQTIGRTQARDSEIALLINKTLTDRGKKVDLYIWNDSSLFNSKLDVPQYVIAWAYPSSLMGYIKKIPVFSKPGFNKNFLFTVLDTIGFYKRDWRAYQNCTRTLPVSKRLEKELLAASCKAKNVYPSIQVNETAEIPLKERSDLQIVMSALNLEDKRKNYKWVLDALIASGLKDISLHLIGGASQSFIEYYKKNLPITFYGLLDRKAGLEVVKEKDIFIFASLIDDWGYVQTESMANGLIVIAPNLSPFDEIVGDHECLFKPGDANDLNEKIKKISGVKKEDLYQLKQKNHKRALSLFSRKIFANNIKQIIEVDIKCNHTNLQ